VTRGTDAADFYDDPFEESSLNAAVRGTPYENKLHYFPTIASTNTHAMQRGRDGAAAHSVYFADEQTAGRGRGGHTWHSAPGTGLYVSVLLRPNVTPAEAQWFSLAAGLAVRNAVHQITALEPDLRWPNDLLLGHPARKFSGILTELHTESSQVRQLVVGMGINVHQKSFPAELGALATSLRIESGRHWPRQQVLVALLAALEQETCAIATPESAVLGRQSILTRVEAVSTWIRGKQVIVNEHASSGAFTGTTAGLDERGFLLVQTPDGLRTVHSGGVREAPAR
jgi:BirA family transcriptional regulator, biotin operon repressor / biotin---[acetyl-CoA-carboxylase] ligase